MDNPCNDVNCPNFIHVQALLAYTKITKEYQNKLEKLCEKLEHLNSAQDLEFHEVVHAIKKAKC